MNAPSRDPSGEPAAWLDALVSQFENAWQAGGPPPLEAFLSADGPRRAAALPELVHVDLERRFKRGESVRVEEYLGRFPELASDRTAVLDLIAAEYRLRRRREPALDVAEFLRRFPAEAGTLSSVSRRRRPLCVWGRPSATAASPPSPATRCWQSSARAAWAWSTRRGRRA
jgi:hypothetical protein